MFQKVVLFHPTVAKRHLAVFPVRGISLQQNHSFNQLQDVEADLRRLLACRDRIKELIGARSFTLDTLAKLDPKGWNLMSQNLANDVTAGYSAWKQFCATNSARNDPPRLSPRPKPVQMQPVLQSQPPRPQIGLFCCTTDSHGVQPLQAPRPQRLSHHLPPK